MTSRQPSLVPPPVSAGTAGPATQRHERPPKILAKGPFWTRLPALRAMTSAVAGSQFQGQGTQPDEANASRLGSAAPPPIVLPDRVGTARILLSDTQSCVQKLSSRMDALYTRNEQALKEVQLAREALDTSGEKAVAEIADVVYKCQATLAKRLEAQDSMLDQANGKISQLMTMNSSLLKLYDAHVTSLNSVTQTMQHYAAAFQSLQTLSITLAPLDPLVRNIPLHVDTALTTHLAHVTDALTPVLERVAEHAVERVLMNTYMLEQKSREHVTRGQKRKRPTGDNVPLMDATRERRLSMARPTSGSIANDEPSSPLLQRQLSGVWAARRLHSRGSQRNKAVESARAASATMQVETPPPVQPSQMPIPVSSRRATLSFPDPSVITASAPARKGSWVQSTSHTTGTMGKFGGENMLISHTEVCVDEINSTAAVGSCAGVTPARITRSQMPRQLTPSFEPLGPVPPSVETGTGEIGSKLGKDLNSGASPIAVSGTENVAPLPITATLPASNSKKRKNVPANGKNKTTKTKGSGGGRRKGKKAASTLSTVIAVTDTQSVQAGNTSSSAVAEPKCEPSKSASKDTSPKRTTTNASDTTINSATPAHGPPNSPSVDAYSSPIQPIDPANARDGQLCDINMQSSTSNPVDSKATSNARSLIGLMNSSQDSALPTQDVAFSGGEGTSLAAALAHVNSDIDFTSGLCVDTEQQCSTHGYANMPIDTDLGYADFIRGSTPGKSSTGTGTGIFHNHSSGRPRRFLVIDDDCTAIDLLDELFDE